MSNSILRVGDLVSWRGCFGLDAPRSVRVLTIEVTKRPREKYGDAVESVAWSVVRENRVVVTVNVGRPFVTWAYGEQIFPLGVS